MANTSRRWALRLAVLATTCLTASVARAADPPRVSFELKAVKGTYLAGEPVVLLKTQRGSAQMYNEGFGTLWRRDTRYRLLVNRGQGFTPFRRKRLGSGWDEPNRKVLMKDGEQVEYILAYDESIGDWVFPLPGPVELMVEYEDEDLGLIRSNVVKLEIKAPEGDEKTVYEALRNAPDRGASFFWALNADEGGPVLAAEWERRLIEKYPRSVYLQGARVRNLNARLSDVTDQVDPSDPTSPPPKQREERERLLRERRAQFLGEVEALAADLAGSQFEPDALLNLASLYYIAGDEERSDQTYARLAKEFPDRWAGRAALQEIADETPPELHVSASPSTLWPPNQKLEPITVAATVTDNVDPNPTVKLVSITCGDTAAQQPGQKGQGQPASQGCDDDDIADATHGTDDREFRLRAQRVGFGPGRVYTITYEASDGAGNKATATTTVTVAHDQGIAKKK